MTASEREKSGSLDLTPPEAGTLRATSDLSAPIDGGALVSELAASIAAEEVFAPSLEDLAQDWLSESTPLRAVPPEEDSSGPLDIMSLEARADAPHVDDTGEFTPEELRGMVASASAVSAPVEAAPAPVPPPIADASAGTVGSSAPGSRLPLEHSAPPARSGGRVAMGLGAVAIVVLGAAIFFVSGVRRGGTDSGSEGSSEVVAADVAGTGVLTPPATATGIPVAGAASAKVPDPSKSEAGAAASSPVVAPASADGLLVESFEVGRLGPGKTCKDLDSTFSIAVDRKIAACYVVAKPYKADRVIVVWEKDGETVRRAVRDAPAAARLVSRGVLSLHDQPAGTWTVRLVRADRGEHTELARQTVVIGD